MYEFLPILELISALYLSGVIVFVQLVHYPLFAELSSQSFIRYQELHQQRTSYVVIIPMCVEFFCAAFLTLTYTGTLRILALALLLVIWGSTFFIQVPIHKQLLNGYNQRLISKLVSTNWLRTICWPLRSAFLIALSLFSF